MSLRLKILAAMALPVIVLIAATVALYVSRSITSDALEDERHTNELHAAFGRAVVDLDDAQTATVGYVVTRKPSYRLAFEQAGAELSKHLATITDLVRGDRAEASGAAELSSMAVRRLEILQGTVLVAHAGERGKVGPLVDLLRNGGSLRGQIATLVDQEEQNAARQLAASEERLDSARRSSFFVGIIGLPLGVLASLAVVMLFMHRLIGRIKSTEEIARLLEEGMPLREPSGSDDELGHLERVLVLSGTRLVELQDELRRMGTTDPSTRFMNRRGFLPTAQHQLKVASRRNCRMALAFLDIDGLKQLNDTQGHAAGDGMIAEAAHVMRQTFRASDLIGRMGGDEFCILFETDSEHDTAVALSRLQKGIDQANAGDQRPFTLSISAGVAVFDPKEPRSLDELLAIADNRMYEQKREKAKVGSSATPAA
jgi:diguanylate cyclase (GGDEF)-like protein